MCKAIPLLSTYYGKYPSEIQQSKYSVRQMGWTLADRSDPTAPAELQADTPPFTYALPHPTTNSEASVSHRWLA
jgi:hypothetical protein